MKKWFVAFIFALQLLSIHSYADTVVCIHGFFTNYRSMFAIKQTLKYSGYETCLWNYEARRGTIEQHACSLIPLLQEIACNCPGRPINFVTHSIGSLVLRAALNLPGCPQEAKMGRAVLLAPPNKGSCLGRKFQNFKPVQFVMGPCSGRQLLTMTPCDILEFGSFPKTMPVLVIAGTSGYPFFFKEPNDRYLAVSETTLETPYYFESFDVSHGGLLKSRKVLCAIRTFFACKLDQDSTTLENNPSP